jgi:hypothetical protein
MELSPSSEATNCADTQEFPSILLNPKVHYRVPVLSQFNSVHTTPSYLSKNHFIIIHPPKSWPSFWLSPPISYIHSLLPIRATCPPFVILLDWIIRIILGEEYKL